MEFNFRVHQGRKTYHAREDTVSDENILCIGSSRKRPVLKWEENFALPGNLTLTEKALYFEVIFLSFAKLCVFKFLLYPTIKIMR